MAKTVVSIELRTFEALCQRFDTPYSLACSAALKSSHDDFISLGHDPRVYNDNTKLSKDLLLASLLSKWKGLKLKENPTDVSYLSRQTQESINRTTNARLRNPWPSRVDGIISMAQRKIGILLGKAPSLLEIDRHCDWSGGATFDLRRGTHHTDKMTSSMTVTPSAAKVAAVVVGHDPLWCESLGLHIDGPCSFIDLTIVKGNRLITVPKNAKTDRTICIEPTLNMFLQKSIGQILRQRLRRWGVNLDDQTPNQNFAQIAQRANLCTVDLKSASDSVTFQLILSLLPIDWVMLLDSLRSKETLINGEWTRIEMFSSMGNGFTFELESLIFHALSSACCEMNAINNFWISTYGDDLIIPYEIFPDLAEVLTYCGFQMNVKKTYVQSPFYESCGKQYFFSKDVTPCYQKDVISSASEALIFHNKLFRWSERTGVNIDEVLQMIRDISIRKFPELYGLFIPQFSLCDRGFLISSSRLSHCVDSHGVYRLKGLSHVAKLAPIKKELAALAEKMRFPKLEEYSDDRKGHLKTTKAYGRYMVRKIKIFPH